MPQMPTHYAGAPFFAASGLPFYAGRGQQNAHIAHDHDFFEIVLVLAGRALHALNGAKHEITKGDVLFIPIGRHHAYLDNRGLEIINLHFDPAGFEKTAFDLPGLKSYQKLFLKTSAAGRAGCFRISPGKFAVLVRLMTGFISEIETKRPGYRAMAAALFIQTMGIIIRYIEHINTPPPLLSRVEQTLDFMETHCDEDISLDQLARIAHMSRSSYQRSFQKLMNASPIKYLISLRVNRSIALLFYRPELNITEIAQQVGFSDSNYFSRSFKKITGKTPREARRRKTYKAP